MKNKTNAVFLSLFVVVVLSIASVNALSPVPPSNICYVKGEILEWEFVQENCIGEVGQQICHPDRYRLLVNITEVSLVEEYPGYAYDGCEDSHSIGERTLFIATDNAHDIEFDTKPFISGEAQRILFSDGFNSYNLFEDDTFGLVIEPIEGNGTGNITYPVGVCGTSDYPGLYRYLLLGAFILALSFLIAIIVLIIVLRNKG